MKLSMPSEKSYSQVFKTNMILTFLFLHLKNYLVSRMTNITYLFCAWNFIFINSRTRLLILVIISTLWRKIGKQNITLPKDMTSCHYTTRNGGLSLIEVLILTFILHSTGYGCSILSPLMSIVFPCALYILSTVPSVPIFPLLQLIIFMT